MPKDYRSKTFKAKKRTEKSFEKNKKITKRGTKDEKPSKIDLEKGDVRLHIFRGRTVNLGNFNSTKMDIGLSRDLGKGEKIKDTFQYMDEFLTDYLDKFANAQEILE